MGRLVSNQLALILSSTFDSSEVMMKVAKGLT